MGYKRVARSQARASCARPSRGAAPRSRRAASGLGDAGAAQLSGDHATRGRKEGNAGFAPGWDAPERGGRAGGRAVGRPAAPGFPRRAPGAEAARTWPPPGARPGPARPPAAVRGAPSRGPRPGHKGARDGFLVGGKGRGEGGVRKTRPSASLQSSLSW